MWSKGQQMKVRLRWYGELKTEVGSREVEVEVPQGTKLRDLPQLLRPEYGDRLYDLLGGRRPFGYWRVILNGCYHQEPKTSLADGDTVAFIPPIAGGSAAASQTLPGRRKRRKAATGVHSVKSAVRVLDILELLCHEGRALTLTEMSSKLGIPMSSLHSLARTLVAREYLKKDEVSLTYQLGSALVALARRKQEVLDLIEEADAELAELNRASGENVSLAVLENHDAVIVQKRVSDQVVRVVNPSRLPAHTAALGKCLLAGLNAQELERLYPAEELPSVTSNAIASRTELRRVLDRVRVTGCAYDREESLPGLFAVSSPVFDCDGIIVAAVGIAAPAVRATPENVQCWEQMVVASAERISAKLGYRE